MTQTIRLAISTCPNDTFAFHGLLTNQVNQRGLDFEIELLDIQQLNDGLFEDCFDVAKASFHAALLLAERYTVLPSGSALGFGVGPLLLAANPDTQPASHGTLTLCPGKHTTATMLLRLFYGMETQVRHVVFSEVMPSLQSGTADFGVCIHEGRFTWQDQGLNLVEDLGARWEVETGCPLPLGGILARKSLEQDVLQKVQATILESLELSLGDPPAALASMRKYAQEFDDSVLMKHVELYVNDWTRELGDVGQAALNELSERAKSVGLITAGSQPLTVYGSG